MFRIEAFCDDKNLPRVLHALMGLVHGQPAIQPVANGMGIKSPPAGVLTGVFVKYAKANKMVKFAARDLADFVKQMGLAPASRGYMLKRLMADGIIKKSGKGANTVYTVQSARPFLQDISL